MKKIIIALVAAAAIPVAVFAASGVDHGGARLDRMTERLGLSAEQRTRLESLFEERRSERRAMRESMQARMAEVLTPEQQTKMQAMREQGREARREHRGREHGEHGKRGHHGGKHGRHGGMGCESDPEREGEEKS